MLSTGGGGLEGRGGGGLFGRGGGGLAGGEGGGCWWEGEEGDLMEEEGGRGMCEWHGVRELSR